MKRALLLAHPAGHSLSPAMHNAAFRALGVAATYEALDVPPEELDAALAALRAPDVLGANVSVPHKEAVAQRLERLTEAARAVGAVNTLVPRGGELEGDNTDVGGFLQALAERHLDLRGARALVLGAGGAARAVVYALLTGGASRVTVHNRTPERARRLAAALAPFGEVALASGDDLAEVGPRASLVINTTSVGMAGGPAPDASPLAAEHLPASGAVVDIVYRPAVTPLLAAARRRGLATQDGRGMLLYQGVAALERWTGRGAPVGAMRAALDAALDAPETTP